MPEPEVADLDDYNTLIAQLKNAHEEDVFTRK